MRPSALKPPLPLETWTKEDVHHWLMTEVKVHQTCADAFLEEEVSGDSLVHFTKEDVLDLGIKHGPAVKITSHLQSLKQQSELRAQGPAYVESWTKEEVHRWLLQHLSICSKYAERLLEEDVSGDCLVYFEKPDFKLLDVKAGPATKILGELQKLNNKPEPNLHASTDGKPAPAPRSTGRLVGGASGLEPNTKMESNTEKMVKNEAQKAFREEDENQHPSTSTTIQLPSSERGDAQQPNKDKPNVTAEIQEILEDLSKDDLKKFHFMLDSYANSQCKPIARSKLEDRDTMDTAKLLTGHYGNEKALKVTKDVLRDINRNDLAQQMEKMGRTEQDSLSNTVLKKEANQGEKLKNLLTCGGGSLDHYNQFVVVVNKSLPEQLQYLHFLSKMKLFCVMDFDPDGGLCQSYKQTRLTNLHKPSDYQGQTNTVLKNLNLYKQVSWVFCNGRRDVDGVTNMEYKTWLRKSCRHVEQLVDFIYNPEVSYPGQILIIFLLLSPVDTENDPTFDTYKSFIKCTQEESIISICASRSIYLKWRELIQDKCEYDIDRFSIYELHLSEINGTIMGLDPVGWSSERRLPSSRSSAVVLKQTDVDFMTALNILCLNQCEETSFDENSSEFKNLRKEVEKDFYKGGKVKWWNFYFCERDKQKPFIKRDKYEAVKKMILSPLMDSKKGCDILTLFHNSGCGGTTLAMHVMWDLRQELRCAVLTDNSLPKEEVAAQVIRLVQLESEEPTPILLLVDDSKESDNLRDLVKWIHKYAADLPNCKVIILNCVRSHCPKEKYLKHNMQSQYITASLTRNEQMEFEKKLKELKESHEKTENFYSFMFMKSNFDRKYVSDLARNTLESFDFSSKKDQLFAFLALLKTYERKSEMSLSLCEDFLGMNMTRWREERMMDGMNPFSNFLIIDTVESRGGFKIVRVLHQAIASACLDELESRFSLKVSVITKEVLHCDLFFSKVAVEDSLMFSVKQMLVERQPIEGGCDRERFSPLIGKIHKEGARETVQDIFVKASSRLENFASIPQALARYLYIKERDFPEALKWAEKAKNINENPYTFDTIGQIHKANLRSNIQEEKGKRQNPQAVDRNIHLAAKAFTAFKAAQELVSIEDEPEGECSDEELEDYPKDSYQVEGYAAAIEIAFMVFDILDRLPFFDKRDPMKKNYLKSFLGGKLPITSMCKERDDISDKMVEIIRGHEKFLLSLRNEVETMFEKLEHFYTYIKQSTSNYDSKNRHNVSHFFVEYVDLFCSAPEERELVQQNNPNLNIQNDTRARRLELVRQKADRFAGILLYLDKPAEEIEQIAECYAFLQNKQQFISSVQRTKDSINYILSNIVLYILKPKSKKIKRLRQLSALLQSTLQEVGLQYPHPDPYYLALLLFWPGPAEENPDFKGYVEAIQKSSHKSLSSFSLRRFVAHVYLGKGEGLKRLFSKSQLDQKLLQTMSSLTLKQNWQNGKVFKEQAIIDLLQRVQGTTEHGVLFASYGQLKIPVHSPFIGGIRSGYSTETVSFYVGFTIIGPLAYDLKPESL